VDRQRERSAGADRRPLGYPVFVKPLARLKHRRGACERTPRKRHLHHHRGTFDRRNIVEKALTGAIEINCALLGNGPYRASALEQPITWQEFLTSRRNTCAARARLA